MGTTIMYRWFGLGNNSPFPENGLIVNNITNLPSPDLKIVAISDTHGDHDRLTDKIIEFNADLLIVSGDLTRHGRKEEMESFIEWMKNENLPKEKIVIAGNHDKNNCTDLLKNLSFFHYLEHETFTLSNLKFFASPYTPNHEVNKNILF